MAHNDLVVFQLHRSQSVHPRGMCDKKIMLIEGRHYASRKDYSIRQGLSQAVVVFEANIPFINNVPCIKYPKNP